MGCDASDGITDMNDKRKKMRVLEQGGVRGKTSGLSTVCAFWPAWILCGDVHARKCVCGYGCSCGLWLRVQS